MDKKEIKEEIENCKRRLKYAGSFDEAESIEEEMEAEKNKAYEQGSKDMWENWQKNCQHRKYVIDTSGMPENVICKHKDNDGHKCNYDTCPIRNKEE